MNLIKPKKLIQGDKITIIAPSGPINYEKILDAKKYFEDKGFRVTFGKHIKEKQDYLAGTCEQRLQDLHDAFMDNDTNAIICARGGFGAIHLIEYIDYELIKQKPKIFCGYSDVTILNAMFLKNANLITFSGPMCQSDFGNNICPITENSFFKTLQSDYIEIEPIMNKSFNNKNCSGILFGGNLTTITSLVGRDFCPNEDFIFFVEDLNEPVYKIDRCFSQLFAIPNFKNNVKAIILGDFLDIDNEQYFENLFKSISDKYGIPVFFGYQISHDKTKLTIPYGAICKLEDSILKVKNYLL